MGLNGGAAQTHRKVTATKFFQDKGHLVVTDLCAEEGGREPEVAFNPPTAASYRRSVR